MDNKILNIVAFCILMENNDGITGKSPDYILEKFNRYCFGENEENYMFGLDYKNGDKLYEWIKKWAPDKLNNY